MILVLATILAGKGFHALQEAGVVGVTTTPLHFRIDLLGIYPTFQTASAQVIAFLLVVSAWVIGRRPSSLNQTAPVAKS